MSLERLRQVWSRLTKRLARARPQLFVSVVVAACYYGTSEGVRNFFPFTVYKMFAFSHVKTAARIVVVDQAGAALDVDYYARFDCEGFQRKPPEACVEQQPFYVVAHREAEAFDYVEAHLSDNREGAPVTLVRRVWRVEGAVGEPPHEDCVISACRADRR